MDSDMLDEAKDKKETKIKVSKEFDPAKIVDVEPTLDEEAEENALIESVCDEALNEVMDRMQRRKAGISARKNKHKMKRGREKAARKTATMDVLKKRARKQAIQNLKQKFSKNRRYAELSAGEKEVIDKRISKIAKNRIDMMAKKLIPGVKIKERQRKMNANVREDLNAKFEDFLSEQSIDEASYKDQKVMARPHMLLDKNNKAKTDGRFKMFKKKPMAESTTPDDLREIADLMEATEEMAEGGLWANIKAKQDRIKKGSGEKMRKPGSKGAPSNQDFKDAAESVIIENPEEEIPMMSQQLDFIAMAAKAIKKSLAKGGDPEEWKQNKLATAHDAVKTLHANIEESVEEEAIEIDEMDFTVKSLKKSGFANLKKASNYDKLKNDIKTMRDRLNKDKGIKPLKAGYESVDGVSEDKDSLANLANKEVQKDEKEAKIKFIPKNKKSKDEKEKELDKAFESFLEGCGAGEEGTPSLTKKLKKDTPSG